MLLGTSQGGLSPAGTTWFFAVITLIGFFSAWFFIPETASLRLESMDTLFTLKWHQIGRMGRAYANEGEQRAIGSTLNEKSVETHVETAEKRDNCV